MLRLRRSSPRTICRFFCNNWTSSGTWLRSRYCARFGMCLPTSDQPLAREAAARALGHMADPGALPVLIKGLGDPAKMVQISLCLCAPHGFVAAAGCGA